MRNVFKYSVSLLVASLLPLTASAVTLDSLLDERRVSPAERAAASEQDRLRGERDERRQERGWELFGGTDAGRYRDLEVGAAGDRFSSYGLTLGVRHPLLGSWRRQQLAVQESQHRVDRQDAERHEAREAHRLALKTAYADWWRADMEGRLCDSVAEDLEQLGERVQRRAERGDITRSAWMGEELRLHAFERDCQRARAQQERAQRRLATMIETPERLSGRVQPRSVALMDHPANLDAWERAVQEHPRMADRRLAVRQAESLPQQRWYHHVDSNVSLSHRAEQRFSGGGAGTGLVASLNFSVPLDASLLQGHAGDRSRSAQRDQARWELQAESDALVQELHEALYRHRQAVDERQFRARQRDQMARLEQEMERRYDLDERVGSLDLLETRLDRIQVEQEWLLAWHLNWLRQAELELISDSLPRGRALLADPVTWPGTWYSEAEEADMATRDVQVQRGQWHQGVYVWDSESLLDAEQRDAELEALEQAGMTAIYMSLSADQLQQDDHLDAQIPALFESARERGMTLHLLLGEPRWILADYREDLLALVRSLDHLPFDSLHLDLEVEQLGWPVEEAWLDGWADTLEAAAEVSPWPLSLSAHHRWFGPDAPGERCMPCVLETLSLDHLSLMIYSTHEAQVEGWLRDITQAWPSLPFRLAQSMEPEPVLSEAESWGGRSHEALQSKNERWQQRYAPMGVSGIDWQAWRYYPRPDAEE